MKLKIASWNVNSIRVRMPHVIDWVEKNKPDILALQETKVQDIEFPIEAIHQVGYDVMFIGQKSYNGVALLYKKGLAIDEVIMALPEFEDEEKRFISARVAGITIVNVYVPNGREIDHPSYHYKLQYLSALKAYLKKALQANDHVLVMGDFNIAPNDIDVHDPEAWAGQVLVSADERSSLSSIIDLGFYDSYRHLYPDVASIFSWWPYKGFAYRRKRGLRIDLILLSHDLQEKCLEVGIDSAPRGWDRPSDHAPVWVICDGLE